MAAKLSNDERVERIREWSRQSSARRRVKLESAGKQQLLCWIPATLRKQLDVLIAQRNQNLSEVTTELLTAALDTATTNQTTTNSNASNDADATLDMFGNPTMDNTGRDEPDTPSRVIQSDKEALMNEVGAMLESGLSGGEIARRWNSEGRRTANGSEFYGANLLRDYRKWKAKKDDSNKV